jgi:hypothetical protein
MHSIEWAAGLFEGEGCMYKAKNRPCSFTLTVGSSDKDVLEKFSDAMGCGKITERTAKKEAHHKDFWVWNLYKGENIRRVLAAMLPHFGNRRAYQALNILDDLELA